MNLHLSDVKAKGWRRKGPVNISKYISQYGVCNNDFGTKSSWTIIHSNLQQWASLNRIDFVLKSYWVLCYCIVFMLDHITYNFRSELVAITVSGVTQMGMDCVSNLVPLKVSSACPSRKFFLSIVTTGFLTNRKIYIYIYLWIYLQAIASI